MENDSSDRIISQHQRDLEAALEYKPHRIVEVLIQVAACSRRNTVGSHFLPHEK